MPHFKFYLFAVFTVVMYFTIRLSVTLYDKYFISPFISSIFIINTCTWSRMLLMFLDGTFIKSHFSHSYTVMPQTTRITNTAHNERSVHSLGDSLNCIVYF